MNDIPYEQWIGTVDEYLKKNGYGGKNILELGCGTGTVSFMLEELGYKVIGTDISDKMLEVAKNKAKERKSCVRFYKRDMRAFDTEKRFSVIICLCDGINYMMNLFDLKSVFENVQKTLKEDGVFIFDLKTKAYFEELGDNVYTDRNDRGQYIWENNYDTTTKDNNYYITFYMKNRLGLYSKSVESQTQHAFDFDEIEKAAREAGLKIKDKFTIDVSLERVYYVMERK